MPTHKESLRAHKAIINELGYCPAPMEPWHKKPAQEAHAPEAAEHYDSGYGTETEVSALLQTVAEYKVPEGWDRGDGYIIRSCRNGTAMAIVPDDVLHIANLDHVASHMEASGWRCEPYPRDTDSMQGFVDLSRPGDDEYCNSVTDPHVRF